MSGDAARGSISGNETPPPLREALPAPQARACRGGAAPSQAVAQAHGARGFLAFVLYHYSPASAGPSFCAWVEAIREISAKSD